MPKHIVHTAYVHPIGEDRDVFWLLAATSSEEIEKKVLGVANEWCRPQPGEGEDPADFVDESGKVPVAFATLEELYANDPDGWQIVYEETELEFA